ncbi:MAG: pyridoxamine 5'-phosphate oxidase [Deferribacteres bacterium]|nr:pyridoxamine 5'-phosphate oxidase [candidate division KSB1 bacterium]MCB9511581.1 pyridoxamine 5'-phosphate oxidase [Deferribacteres bacterium]
MQAKKTDEPLSLFAEWYHLAHVKHVEPQDTVMCVSTVSPEGRPSSRMVLLKSFDENGFVFYTNLESRKARHIQHNPYAALCFFWPEMLKQVRIEGAIAQIESQEADAYFATRPRESQIASWASKQSEVMASRDDLMTRFREFEQKFKGKDISRPPFWSGYRVQAERFEFWIGHQYRLNERILYRKEGDSWAKELLYP